MPADWRAFLKNPRFHLAALLLVGASIYLNQLWIGGLPGNDDGTYAAGALDMLDRGDYLTPRFNGDPQFSTAPPAFYWMLMLSFKALGPTDFAARSAGAAATVLTILAVFAFAYRLFGKVELAALAGVAFALDPFILKFGHHALAHTAWMGAATAALAALDAARRRPAFYLAFAAFSALSILFKSLLGCFPLMIGALWLLWDHASLKDWLRFAGAAALALALGSVWYLVEYQRYGRFFLNEHFGKMLFDYAFQFVASNSTLSPWVHVSTVLSRVIRSSMIVLPLTLWALWKDRGRESKLVFLWIAVPIGCLMATARFEPRYMAPAFAGMAVGLGFYLDGALSQRAKQNILISVYGGCLAWALATLAYPIPRGRNHLAETAELIQSITQEVPPDQRWLLIVSPKAVIDPQWPNHMLAQYYELSGPLNRGVIQQVLFYTRRRYRLAHAEDLATDAGSEEIILGQDRYLPPGSLPSLKPLLKGPDWTLYRRATSSPSKRRT